MTKRKPAAESRIVDWTPESQRTPEAWHRRQLIETAYLTCRGDDRDRVDAANAALTREGLATTTRTEVAEVMDVVYSRQRTIGINAETAYAEHRQARWMEQRRRIILTALRESRERGDPNQRRDLEAVNLALSHRGEAPLHSYADLQRELAQWAPRLASDSGEGALGEVVDKARRRPATGWLTDGASRAPESAQDRRDLVQKWWSYLSSEELHREPGAEDEERLLDLINLGQGPTIGLDLLRDDLAELGLLTRFREEDDPDLIEWEPSMTEVDELDPVEEALAEPEFGPMSGASAAPGRLTY